MSYIYILYIYTNCTSYMFHLAMLHEAKRLFFFWLAENRGDQSSAVLRVGQRVEL